MAHHTENLATAGAKDTHALTTLKAYLPGLADNVSNGIGIWRWMKERNLVEHRPLEGPEGVITLGVADDTYSAQHFDDADVLTVAPSQELKDAREGRYNFTAAAYISWTESLENTGKWKIRDLLKTRLNALEEQSKVGMARVLVGTRGSNAKRGSGLRDLMGGGSPTAFQSGEQSDYLGVAVEDINNEDTDESNLWSVHCDVITQLGANNSEMSNQLLDLKLDLQKWGGKPRVGIADAVYYKEFAKMLRGASVAGYGVNPITMYRGDRPSGKVKKFDPDVPDLAWQGADVVYDCYVAVPSDYTAGTDGHCNWIDPRHWKIVIDPRANWKLLPPRKLSGNDEQLVNPYRLLLRYTTWCNKRNAHALTVLNL